MFYMAATRFRMSIRTLQSFTRLEYACGSQNGLADGQGFADVKETLRCSTRLLQALPKSKRTLRSSTILVHALRETKRTRRSSTRFPQVLRKRKWTLRSCYTLSGCKKPTLRCSTRLLRALHKSKRTVRRTTRLCEVKLDSPKLLHALRM